MPVPWRNSLGDGALPPPIIYLRSCIAGDSAAVVQWVGKAARPCRADGQHAGAPDGARIGCNAWCAEAVAAAGETAAAASASMTSLGRARALQQLGGLRHRLEVFRKGAPVGWALRTLEPIARGELVMEYCGEHCSRATAESRVAAERRTDIYLMEIGSRGRPRGGVAIDALHARNASAFANFACVPNMKKEPVFVQHWDRRLPHAAFFAVRDIRAGEELTYRRDEGAGFRSRVSGIRCLCGHPECRKWV